MILEQKNWKVGVLAGHGNLKYWKGWAMKFGIIILIGFVLISCGRNSVMQKVQKPELGLQHQNVHFSFNSDDVLLSEKKMLDENAEWLKKNEEAVIILAGHCDETGDSHYNIELGDRRARSVKAELIARGVEYDRVIMVVSFGDKMPVDKSHNLLAYRKNRRVEFILR